MIAIIPMNGWGISNEQDTLEEESEAFLKLIILRWWEEWKASSQNFHLDHNCVLKFTADVEQDEKCRMRRLRGKTVTDLASASIRHRGKQCFNNCVSTFTSDVVSKAL